MVDTRLLTLELYNVIVFIKIVSEGRKHKEFQAHCTLMTS